MSTSKYFNAIAAVVLAAAVLFTSVLFYLSKDEEFVEAMSYSKTLPYEEMFDQFQIMEIAVELEQEDWEDILKNPLAEEYKRCDVTINGTLYTDIAVRTKGNTSLSQVASSDSDRYSLKLEFDHYDKNKSWNGLDKLVLNNLFCDASYVKEYMAYDMFRYIGVEVPYYAFADLSINGAGYGCYLALEALEDSFLQRVYGGSGQLYKPESEQFGGGGQNKMPGAEGVQPMQEFGAPPQGENPEHNPEESEEEQTDEQSNQQGDGQTEGQADIPAGDFGERKQPPEMPAEDSGKRKQLPEMPAENFGGSNHFGHDFSGGGADLLYTDDDSDSYSDIFDNAVFDPTDEEKQRVITALKKLSDKEELETYIDVDACLRYFAAQTFLVNLDSYYSNLKHNYYLYEKDGQLTILPWDLNLAFGGFQCSDATEAVNGAIDTPMGGGLESERPLFGRLMEVDEYKELYHSYLREITQGYINSGQFTTVLSKVTTLITPYVKKDATAFYSYEEFAEAAGTLKTFVLLRAQSVEKQLDGQIPSDGSRRDESTALVDASTIDLHVMGVQGGDGAGGKGSIYDLKSPPAIR